MCVDDDDIGGLDSPKPLPPIDDKDVTPRRKVIGKIKDSNDVDAFRFTGNDTTFALLEPYAKINVAGAELCLLAKCTNATTEVTKCTKGSKRTEGGLEGCCGSSEASFELNCDGPVTDTADYTIVVRSTSLMCTSYEVEYSL
jgi:hypothetical protein